MLDNCGIKIGNNKIAHTVVWRGHESATTRRIGYTVDLWTVLRGYDEVGILGSGSQDIDMANRCKAFTGEQVFARYSRGSIENAHNLARHPLPNDPKDARGRQEQGQDVPMLQPD